MLGRMMLRYRRSPGTCGARGAAISAPVRYRIGSSGATACRERGDEPDCRAIPPATAAPQQPAAAGRLLRAGLAAGRLAGALRRGRCCRRCGARATAERRAPLLSCDQRLTEARCWLVESRIDNTSGESAVGFPMTSEVCMMNRLAVVLAADSATTVTYWGDKGKEERYFKGANMLRQAAKHN